MNSHSWFEVADASNLEHQSGVRRLWGRISPWRYPLLFIVLPTLLVAAYFYLIAADQYQSEAHFVVSSNSSQSAPSSGISMLLGSSAGGGAGQNQSYTVPDYLESHDAVEALRKKVDLVAIFQSPRADWLSRLTADPVTPEVLQRYYERMVKVHFDRDTGITSLKVRAFSPQDAQVIASHLLQLSERQVNVMNRRRYEDAVSSARNQVTEAEQRVGQIQKRITAYRQNSRDVDPEVSGQSQIELVSTLKAKLSAAQSSLATMRATISQNSPQYLAMERQVRSLQTQIAAQSAELTGSNKTIASNLGGYEDLRVQQQFAAKSYEAAASSLVKARDDAARQQLYIVRVVDANLPVKSLFPQRERIIFITFLALCLAYGIGWLIVAGVKEHAA